MQTIWLFPPSSFTHGFLLLSKCWLEFKLGSAPEYIFGVGNCVFGGFRGETRTCCHYLHYAKIRSSPRISCATSDKSLHSFQLFFFLVLVHLPTSGNVVKFSKVLQSRPVSCIEESHFGWCFTDSKRCLCLGTRYAKHKRRNKPGGEVICPYLRNSLVTGQGLGPKGFCLIPKHCNQ